MTTKVSILTPTYRDSALLHTLGGWLQEQVFQDFEWLLLDDLYEQRKEEVTSWGFPFLRHLQAWPSEVRAPSAVINHGLVQARGDLIYFLADYMQPTPGVLARHWALYQRLGPKVMIGGPLLISECPTCMMEKKEIWPSPEETIWVTRCSGCGVPMVFLHQRNFEFDLGGGIGEIKNAELMRQTWWVGRNESVPLQCLLDINGLDETLDGRGGDCEMGTRLRNLGCRFIIDRVEPAIMHPHNSAGKPSGPRLPEALVPENPLWMKVLAGETWAPNTWNIRETRNALQRP